MFCFEELIGKNTIDVLKELKIEFNKIGLTFVCIRTSETNYHVTRKNIHRIANRTRTKVHQNLYYRTSTKCYDTVLIDNKLYAKLNLNKRKPLFQTILNVDKLHALRRRSNQHFQFITIKLNKAVPSIDIATSILLNNFDISGCQSAVFHNNDGNIEIVGTYGFLYSLKIKRLLYNFSEYTTAISLRTRIGKYADKYKIPTLLPLKKMNKIFKLSGNDNFTINAILLYDELFTKIIKNRNIRKIHRKKKTHVSFH